MLIRHAGVDGLYVVDQFSGGGGASHGIHAVPGIDPEGAFGANHSLEAIETYLANNPQARWWHGDIQAADALEHFPYAPLLWSSPACPAWTNANGEKVYFDRENQLALWTRPEDLTQAQAARMRSRALMEEVINYLRHWIERYGRPVLAGCVENVWQVRKWAYWGRWLKELRKLGYIVRVIALNSMHVEPRTTLRTPQSRNRAYIAFIHESIGRLPDWDKWLRPEAYCPRHEGWVRAVQTFKTPGADMGVYGIKNGQYVYRCPLYACRGQLVEPPVLPATECIDATDPGTPIGDRPKTPKKPYGLEEATLERIVAGTTRHWTNGMRPRLVLPMRGGGDKLRSRLADVDPAHTVSAQGFHHGYVSGLLVPYYGNGNAITVDSPIGTIPTRDRWSLVNLAEGITVNLDQVLFRMLKVTELQRAMSLPADYILTPTTQGARLRLLGNAVTPPAAEVIMCALVEAITATEISRYALAA
ncbi:DNA methyltransferase [Streptosporangium sp. NPDC020072]|uniref:DNA methyltransferase n=1 Tax=Streptosporangium sp. NPDC020072 TaxID=3154788 RepID=UPI0034183460